jgi:MarR family transcriptional regulator for hemolysin
MLKYDFESSVAHSIFMSAHAYERAMNGELAPEGITNRQCQVLGWLALEGALSQIELAERMTIEPPTLVGILDRMERDGLLTRAPCATDRRRKIVTPLPKAEAVWQKIIACGEGVHRRATEGMSSDQLGSAKVVLDQVRANLTRLPAAKSA